MQAPILLDALLKAMKESKVPFKFQDLVKQLYEVTFREAYAAGAERLEDDDEQ